MDEEPMLEREAYPHLGKPNECWLCKRKDGSQIQANGKMFGKLKVQHASLELGERFLNVPLCMICAGLIYGAQEKKVK